MTAVVRPYKGLAAFDDAPVDALLFFGREREREIIVANLLASRLTVLYGPTGVGKSSLLNAGVVHQLRRLPDVTVATFSAWREDPTDEVDEVVDAAEGETYLVFDQIEEYFLYHDQTEPFARRLPELVTESGLRVNVLLGIREDALAKLDFFKGRIPNLFGNYLRLDHLDRAAARGAILGPLERMGELSSSGQVYTAEPELVEEVLDQVATGRIEYGLAGRGTVGGDREEPTRVEAPFLQLVLERLWDEEQSVGSNTLRPQTLERLGGAETIVRGHLDHALAALDPEQRELAAEVFGHLVTPSGTKIAHEMSDLARYAAAPESAVAAVLSRLAAERIVRSVDGSSKGGRYEIFHDVLASGVLSWRVAFDAERELERERARRKRAISFAGAALLALVGVTAVAIFALVQREHARDVSRRAQARELAAQANLQLTVDPLRSVALARRAAELESSPYVERQLRDAVSLSHVRAIFRSPGGPVTNVASSLGGTRFAAVSASGSIRVIDVRTAETIATLRHPPGVVDAVFSRDSRVLVTVGRDGRARILDPTSGRVLRELRNDGAVTALALSPDATVILTGGVDGTATLWRATTGERLLTVRVDGPVSLARFDPAGERIAVVTGTSFEIFRAADGRAVRSFEQAGTVLALDFSSSGQLVATGGADKRARIWRVDRGELLHSLGLHVGRVVDVSFSRQGTHVATASTDGTARVWHVATGVPRATLFGHRNYVNTVRFSRNGLYVLTASRDGSARVWSAAGRHHAALLGHAGDVRGAVFAAGGGRVITWGDDGTSRLWQTSVEPELSVVARHGAPVTSVAFGDVASTTFSAGESGEAVLREHGRVVRRFVHGAAIADAVYRPDLGLVVTAGADGVARIWRRGGREPRELRHGSALAAVAVSPDGARVATAGEDRQLVIWALAAGERLQTVRHDRLILDVAFDPSGERIATAEANGVVRVWAGLRVERVLRGHRDAATAVAFAPGGVWLASSSRDHDARLWNARTGKLVRVLSQHFAIVSDVAFSSDGRWLATAGPANVNLWPLRSGGLPIPLRGHEGTVLSVAFAPGLHRVVSGGADGTVRVHACDICGRLPDLIPLAERRLADGQAR
jgi:WD40 repeat protein